MSNYIVRFSLKQRIEHFITMTTFAMLCLTGLPQKFYQTGWAASLVGRGGPFLHCLDKSPIAQKPSRSAG